MPYTCPNPKHKRHANRKACPDYVEPHTVDAPQTSTPPPGPTTPPEQQSAPPTTPPKPADAPTPPKGEEGIFDRMFGWNRQPASTVSSTQTPTAQQSYVLDGDDVVGFWQIVFSLLEMVINLFLAWIEAKSLPKDLCDLQASNAKKMLLTRNMAHTTSQIFITLGVKTKAEAHALVAEGEGIIAFGGIFIGIGMHLVTEVPKSKKWQEWTKAEPAKPGEKSKGLFDFGIPEWLGGKKADTVPTVISPSGATA